MDVPLLTTTSRRSPAFTWCCVSGKECRSSSRPSLARQPVLGWTAASLTSFPLGSPRTTSLRLARQVQDPTCTWSRAHYSGDATDAWGGANLHVTRKQQPAAMQATCPGKSLNTGLTSRATITSPSCPTLPHARLNPRHSSTLYDAHEPRLRLGRGKLGKHSGRLRQVQTTRREGQASRREQSNPATWRLPRQGIATRLQYTPMDSDVRRDVPATKHCNSFVFPLVPLPSRL
jgi:hypothetical protein